MTARSLLALAIVFSAGFARAHSICSDSLLALSDKVKLGHGVQWTGTVARTSDPSRCQLPRMSPIPRGAFTGILVQPGRTIRMDTGFHGFVQVRSGGKLLVAPGIYKIANLDLHRGAVLEVDTSLGSTTGRAFPGVELWVGGNVQLSEGVTIRYPGVADSLAASRIAFYVARDAEFGMWSSVRGQWVVKGSVKVGNWSVLHGRILAHDIRWGYGSRAVFAANGLPLSPALVHDVGIQGARRFWTRDTSVEVVWTIDGVGQDTQTVEPLAIEGPHWIRRSFGTSSDSVLAMVDRTAPDVSIVSPIAGSILTRPMIPVVCLVDGILFTDTAMLRSGQNSLLRSFQDSAGNWASARVQLVADLEPPMIRKGSVPNPIQIPFEQSSLRLEWFVSDDLAVVALEVNGTRLWAQEGRVSLDVRPSAGDNRYVLTVSDPGGHIARDTVVVVRELDRIVPRLFPSAGHGSQTITRNDELFELVWGVTDNDSIVAAKVNGVPVMFRNGRIESLQRLNVGRNVFVGEATDRSGNVGRDTVVIVWSPDLSAPVLSARAGHGSQTLTQKNPYFELVWNVFDNDTVVSAKVNNQSAMFHGGLLEQMVRLESGRNVFVAEATDRSRNIGRDTVVIVWNPDTLPPQIGVYPGTGSRTVGFDSSAVYVIWSVSDQVKVGEVTLNGRVLTTGSRKPPAYNPPYEVWRYPTFPTLQVGTNVFVLEARDAERNIARDTVVITRQSPQTVVSEPKFPRAPGGAPLQPSY